MWTAMSTSPGVGSHTESWKQTYTSQFMLSHVIVSVAHISAQRSLSWQIYAECTGKTSMYRISNVPLPI